MSLSGHYQVALGRDRQIVTVNAGVASMTRSIPLARADEVPRSISMADAERSGNNSARGNGGAMRNDHDFGGVHVEAIAKSRPGGLGHDHDLIRQCNHLIQYQPLMRGWILEDCVSDDYGGHVEPLQRLEHFVTVDTAVEAVLVLYDCHVTRVQRVRTCVHGAC